MRINNAIITQRKHGENLCNEIKNSFILFCVIDGMMLQKLRDFSVSQLNLERTCLLGASEIGTLLFEAKDEYQCTPLHTACESGYLQVVQYLIKKG